MLKILFLFDEVLGCSSKTHPSIQENTSRFKGNFSFSFLFWFLISCKKFWLRVNLLCPVHHDVVCCAVWPQLLILLVTGAAKLKSACGTPFLYRLSDRESKHQNPWDFLRKENSSRYYCYYFYAKLSKFKLCGLIR